MRMSPLHHKWANDVEFCGMDEYFETGCHCPVEPCARNCPSSVVYHGSAGRLHCVFLVCFCCWGWCKHDFLHVAYVIIDNLCFALVLEGYPSVVIDVDYNDVVFYGMDEYFWNGVSLSGRTVHTDLSELGCVSRFNGVTSLFFLGLFLLFRMMQAWFFACGMCDHWQSSFCFSLWRIPVGCDRCGL